jgi:glycosyltransferase involved in cell wall biosynthesis
MREAPRQRAAATRVAVFPDMSAYNPYQALVQRALDKQGIEVVEAGARLTPRWVLGAQKRGVDAVHLHWLELLAFDPRRRFSSVLDTIRTFRLCLALKLLRRSRLRLVWTVHNLKPHESAHPRLYRMLERAAAASADAVLVHSRYAAQMVERELRPRGRIEVGYHGSYLAWYPIAQESRDSLRSRYGLAPDSFVFLLFGQVRAYKRVAEAVRTFSDLDGAQLSLLVAGNPKDQPTREELEALAAKDGRVALQLRWIGDEEVEGVHRASDAIVLNYAEIFSSGALLLAWSLGRPVIAPTGGTTDELEPHGPIESFAPGGLGSAMTRAVERFGDGGGEPREDALAAARRFDWDEMAERLRELYGTEAHNNP